MGDRAIMPPTIPPGWVRSPHPRITLVDPRGFTRQASAVLGVSWEPPCLCYPPEYLRWQFDFPGNPPALAAVAFVDQEPVGFDAVIPRRLRGRDGVVEVHLMTFGAVLPEYRGTLAVAVYRSLLQAIQEQGRPVLAFSEPGSVAERMLIGTLRASGYRHQPLGHYSVHAYLPRGNEACEIALEEAADLEDFLAVVEQCGGRGVLWNAPDLQQLEHYRVDPRGRRLVVARRRSGEAVGAAMVVLSEAVTRQGLERVAMVDNRFLPIPTPELLKAVLEDAGRRWRDRVTSPVVTLPNTCGLEPDLVRSIGLRATASRFNAHLFTTADGPSLDARSTTLEVV
jgi:hypothetical protein